MRRLTASLLALVLGAAAAVALVSCGGGGNAELLPGNTAKEITANLDKVKQLASGGDCVGAQSEAQQVSAQIDALGGVDKRLKQALREGAVRLNEVVANCSTTTTVPTAPTTVPATTDTSRTTTTNKKPPKKLPTTPTTTTPTTPTTSTPTTPTSTTPTTPTPAPPTGGGGTGAPSGGVGPSSPAGN